MYTEYARNLQPRANATPENEEAKEEQQDAANLEALSAEDGLNEEDTCGIRRPNYILNDIYLVRLECPPFFGFVR